MGEDCNERLKHVCIVCFKTCDHRSLETHHHCCDRDCENQYFEIHEWERSQFGESFIEKLSKCY